MQPSTPTAPSTPVVRSTTPHYQVTRTSSKRGIIIYVGDTTCATTLTKPLPLERAHYYRQLLTDNPTTPSWETLPPDTHRKFDV